MENEALRDGVGLGVLVFVVLSLQILGGLAV